MNSEKAASALEYIKGLELETGGIRGWEGSRAYPEVSGYLIPTLLDYGERDLATRIADWLVSIQNDDGSFCDMDGQKRSFDTAAVMEGLVRRGYFEPALKARRWLGDQIRDDGTIKITPETDKTHLYTMRVSALIGSRKGSRYWMSQEWPDTREHYVAYALEGLWKVREFEFVIEQLLISDWESNEQCANAQFAILHHQAGLNYTRFVNLVESHSGELDNSWTAKWMLDMWKVIGD